ncbi:4-hydroxybenzoate polyprenyltransferase [Rubidibacter lacunae KORDI 51-2]|uniref:4-hydroxybenzoate polyprenyltransferase n=1 Tax=Rubidibacter lacunae KORDI 51-2 TaxID=582515 RepID=U5DKJ7_9CHRO|nr:homogentisate phytyltransferase [Rubidibacter lacunae]ERN40235.1 4-hydroxybenzoate polyprenyltransferase [Rubidibacter lacunae KORDI 51-2]
MSQPSGTQPRSFWREPRAWLQSFWTFSRPHTVIGTSLSVWALYAIAVDTVGEQSLSGASVAAIAWLACLGGNIYIVGLNQLTDVGIDRINKPHLPIAAGEFAPAQARWLVGLSGSSALAIAALSGRWLFATIATSLIVGTAYSLPPIRLKRSPLLAALCILFVRGVVVNLGLFLHFTSAIAGRELLTPSVWALSGFIFVFTIAIAIFKDVPDLEGDKQFNITTLTILLGKRSVFNIARWIASSCYLGLIAVSLVWEVDLNPVFLVATHFLLLGGLWWRSRGVDLDRKPEIVSFYQFIWKLFFLEYLLLPAACWLA